MNILFLTPEYYLKASRSCGGLGVYIRKTAASLADRGHRVSVLWLSNRNFRWTDGYVIIEEIQSAACLFPRLPRRLSFIKNFLTFFLDRWRIKNIIKKKLRRETQVIQVASYQALAVLCPKEWPFITRLSSLESLLIEARGTKPTLFERCVIWSELHQIKNSKSIFGPSEFIAQKAMALSHRHVSVIPTVAEKIPSDITTDFYNDHLLNKKYLLYFGQLSRIKGTDILIQSLEYILNKFPDIYMIFIGRDDGLPKNISCRQYASIVLANHWGRIKFFPPLSHAELIPCIQNAFCVIQPSRVDNLPNTCIEALSLNKVVIGTYPTSIEELVKDGVNGFLVPREDPIALSKCICEFLRGKKKAIHPGLINNKANKNIEALEHIYKNCR